MRRGSSGAQSSCLCLARLACPIGWYEMLCALPSRSLPVICCCSPEIHEQCFRPEYRRQVRAQKAGCLPFALAAPTHSKKDSSAPQKVAGLRSCGFHHRA